MTHSHCGHLQFESNQGSILEVAPKLRMHGHQERDRIDDSQARDRLGKCGGTLKKVKITRHKVVGLTVSGQIEIRFILRVASQSDAGADFVYADGDSFNSGDKLGDHVIRQLPELGSNLRSTDKVLHFSKDWRTDVEIEDALFRQSKAGTRRTRPPGSSLQEYHAVKHDAGPVRRHRLF